MPWPLLNEKRIQKERLSEHFSSVEAVSFRYENDLIECTLP